ncbi:MAG: ABC transporter substrate-binding protein [Planctomycetes bacterium]|nr:ABC transporter substrate-binding protein [Planctomycetota bacterium]
MIRSSARTTFAGVASAIALAAGVLAAGASAQTPAAPSPAKKADPTSEEVPLPALAGWNGTLVIDNDVGVWTTLSADILPGHGCPQIVGLDDKGRCIVLFSYSGKWTPLQTVEDGEWLGAFEFVDLDPQRPGREIYTGGKRGNLFCIQPNAPRDPALKTPPFQTDVVARFPGEELHTMVGGDLLPSEPGNELLLYTLHGAAYRLKPPREPRGMLVVEPLGDVGGRVREAKILPARAGEAPWIACVLRSGEIQLQRLTPGGIERKTITKEPMGFGRLALRKSAVGEPVVFYATRDDGVVLRFEGSPDRDAWTRELVYAGPQGPRGLACGRFSADPDEETIAVFGYAAKVQLLSRKRGQPWRAETIFVERDKGHWLAAAELDGRNATDELIASGYGKRVVLLSRPPGYGLSNVPTDPDPPQPPTVDPGKAGAQAAPEGKAGAQAAPAGDGALRVAVRARLREPGRVDPLKYHGGFETKTLVYETLVTRDAAGRIAPKLASAWELEDGGATVKFTLREGATFHDGTPVDAQAVAMHFRRVLGLPEHAWLRGLARVRSVDVDGSRVLRFRLDAPCSLLPDLCAVNPCSIRAPSTLDREGEFVRAIGSGPFKVEAADSDGMRLAWTRGKARSPVQLVFASGAAADLVDRVLGGELDVVADGWSELVDRSRVAALRDDPRVRVIGGPGSSVTYLSFLIREGPTADPAVRAAVAAAIDRAELVKDVEFGCAQPCATFAAPAVADWPRATPRASATDVAIDRALVVVGDGATRDGRLAGAIVAQLARRGIAAQARVLEGAELAKAIEGGEYDVRIERTWGVPYDPYLSFVNRFSTPTTGATAATKPVAGFDAELARIADALRGEVDPARHGEMYRKAQARIEEASVVVPLFVAERVGVVRSGVGEIAMGVNLYEIGLEGVLRGR